MSESRAYLAAVGDVNDPRTWSGIPYHFLGAARRGGLLDEGLALPTDGPAWRGRRIRWNLARLLTGDRRGGYQYSTTFLERLWRPVRPRLSGAVVVSCFQLLPPSVVADPTIDHWFFIDQTLVQVFDYYGLRPTVGRRIAREALEREAIGYRSARGVIAHSRWAAESVAVDHGVDRDRIHVALPGANLDPEDYRRWEETAAREPGALDRPPRLVFVGKDWRRKGLDRLLRAVRWGRQLGLRATLRVVGCPAASLPEDLRRVEGVEWIGFVDKRREAPRFLDLVAGSDVGCLLSRAEAGGISLREFHALGLPVLAPDTGGSPEHAFGDASILVDPDADDEAIARLLLDLEADPARLLALRSAAWARRREALWSTTVRRIAAFF